MRNLKKVLGLVLCLAMMLSIMVVGAGAAFADQSDIDTKHTEAVDMCNALNIITGFENGKFMPKDNVTREQMAKMICVLDNGGKEPQLATGNTFTDVPADRWSNKYIEACASRGVVVGVGGGKFAPAGKVTATQAAKMLLVELGYDDDLQKYSGSDWATKVNVDATKKGYYKDLEDIDVSAPLTREHAAQMIWNALQAKEVEYSYTLVTNPDGSITSKVDVKDKDETLMEDKYGIVDTDETTGIMTAISYNTTKEKWTYTIWVPNNNAGFVMVANNERTFTSDQDFTDLLGHNVTFVVDKDDATYRNNAFGGGSTFVSASDVYGAYATDSVVLVSGVIGDIDFDDFDDGTINVDDTDYDITLDDDELNVAYFAPDKHEIDLDDTDAWYDADDFAEVPLYYAFSAIDNDDDDSIDLMIIYPVAFGKVTNVASDSVRLNEVTDLDGILASNKLDTKETYDYTLYDNAKKDDWALVTPDTTLTTKGDVSLLEKNTGTVASYADDDAVIDGSTYGFASLEENDQNAVKGALNKTIAFRSINDYLVWIDASGSVDLSDYVLVTGVAQAKGASGYYEAEVLFTDGSTETVKVKEVAVSLDANGSPAYVAPVVEADAGEGSDANLVAGTLYTYEVSSGKYQLTVVSAATDNFTGFDGTVLGAGLPQAQVTGVWTPADSAADANAKIKVTDEKDRTASAKIAPDAIVFVKDDGDYSVKTGADLSKVTDNEYVSPEKPGVQVLVTGAEQNSSTNAMTVTFAYVDTDGTSQSDTMYGYITSSISTSKDSDGTYQTATIWNGEQSISLTTKDKVTFKGADKGDIIAYKMEGNAISEVTLISETYGAVSIINDEDSIQISVNGATPTDYDIDDDDTTVLYIDSEKVEGVATGSLSVANNHYTKNAETGMDEIDGLVYNVLFVPGSASDKPLKLLVVEVNNEFDGMDSYYSTTV